MRTLGCKDTKKDKQFHTEILHKGLPILFPTSQGPLQTKHLGKYSNRTVRGTHEASNQPIPSGS